MFQCYNCFVTDGISVINSYNCCVHEVHGFRFFKQWGTEPILRFVCVCVCVCVGGVEECTLFFNYMLLEQL